ncbi:MAG TPA: thioredoxin [Candidatus Limnocylindrales bacterium]|nr:thioredoxin [Candidatus Limnocylindrales bacterium]
MTASRTRGSSRHIVSSRTSRARAHKKGHRIPMAEIRVATDANFEELVLKSERPVVVDFWAAWCGPCKMVAPEMEKLAAKYDGAVDVVKVDVDANPGLSQAFNILSIPVIAFFKPGSQPQGVVGFRPLEQLEQTFNLAEYAVDKIDVAAPAAD